MGNDASKAPVFISASTPETSGSLNGDPTVGKTAPLAPLQRGVIYSKDEDRVISEFIENLALKKDSRKKLDLEERMKEIIDKNPVTEKLRDECPIEYETLVKGYIEAIKCITAWDDKLKFNVVINNVEYGDMSPAIKDAWILYQKEKKEKSV